ncbi:MAG: hypothetical protein ABEH66_06195 [Halobacteriales archaeon]
MDGDPVDGEFRLTWCIAHGERHDAVRAHVFHAVFDPETERLSALDGTDFGGTVTWSDMAGSALQAFEGQHASSPKHAFGETTHVVTTYLDPGTDLLERWVSTWDDDAGDWHAEVVPDSRTNHMYSGCYPRVNDDGNLEVHAITGEGRTTVLKGGHRGGDFAVFVRGADGWERQTVCSEEDVGHGISRISTVRGGTDELASVFVEAENDPEAFDLSLYACGTAFEE